MRHRKAGKKLGRNTSSRKALMRSLLRGLIISERIKTSYVKAKEASSLADKLISLGKKNTITAKKTAIETLGSKEFINRLFDEIAPRYANRNGGYTRVLQLARRKGDGAKMALLELTERKVVEKPEKKKTTKKEPEEKKKATAEEKKQAPKDQKTTPPAPQKEAPDAVKEKMEEVKGKEQVKTEKKKLGKGFFKDIRRYFRRKSI